MVHIFSSSLACSRDPGAFKRCSKRKTHVAAIYSRVFPLFQVDLYSAESFEIYIKERQESNHLSPFLILRLLDWEHQKKLNKNEKQHQYY